MAHEVDFIVKLQLLLGARFMLSSCIKTPLCRGIYLTTSQRAAFTGYGSLQIEYSHYYKKWHYILKVINVIFLLLNVISILILLLSIPTAEKI